MASIAKHHAEWLSLLEVSGPFLSMPVLMEHFPQGLEKPADESARKGRLRLAYDQWEENRDSRRPDPAIHRAWVTFILRELLEFSDEVIAEGQSIPESIKAVVAQQDETLRPDLMIVTPQGEPDAGKPRLLVQIVPPGQGLEKALGGSHWKVSPATRMTELLHGTGVRLGLVTNGEQWMLVDAPVGETTGYITWYASLWFEEPLTLRSFMTLLSVYRFFGVSEPETLESLLKKSAENQQEVTERLGYQVRRAVEVLVQTIDRIDKDRNRTLLAGAEEKELYQAALTVMMRLVFLFSAEERGLLLLGDDLYDQNYAVSTLRAQLIKGSDETGEVVLGYRKDAWCRLLATFRAVHGGVKHEEMRLPAYGGALFDPDRFPFLEGRASGEDYHTAHPLPVDNRTVLHLLEALQVLQVDAGKGVREARLLSFRALDIEQIGHVYEGLLDHTAVRADEPVLGLNGTKDKEPEVPLSHLEEFKAKGEAALLKFLKEETGKSESALQKALNLGVGLEGGSHLRAACDNDDALYARILPFAGLVRTDTFGKPLVITSGSVYVTQGSDRRTTGTHYTPRSLTEPIVKRTLDPLLYQGISEGVEPTRVTLKSAQDILDLKVCDMATGSGAFLVQACRYLSERLVEAWEKAEEEHPGQVIVTPEGELSTGDPSERIIPADTDERLAVARRLIADRCLYGVDKNPMAVEMAKLSLWLITLQKARPFTFLDHSIKSGDSLVGIDKQQLLTWSLDRKGSGPSILGVFVERDLKQAIEYRWQLAQIREETVADVRRKERLNAAAEAAMERVKLAADLIVAPSFKFTKPKEQADERNRLQLTYIGLSNDESTREELRRQADAMLAGQTTFHWPLEFPEVFSDGRDGFDAIIGNPPFQGGQKITGTLGVPYREWLVNVASRGNRGSADLVAYFYLRASQLLKTKGTFGLIATNSIAEGVTREVGLSQLIKDGLSIYSAVSSLKWPGPANLEVSIAHLHNGLWDGVRILDGNSVKVITDFLNDGQVIGKPFRLKENEGKSFQGSIPLGMGFVLESEEAKKLIELDPKNADVLRPYLNGEDITTRRDLTASRWIINFGNRTLSECENYPDCLKIVREKVKPERDKVNRASRRDNWWKYAEQAVGLYKALNNRKRVLVTPQVSKYGLIAFADTNQVISMMLIVLIFDDYATFTMLQSSYHDYWTRLYSSSLETRRRYTPADCFDTYPFPRTECLKDTLNQIGQVYCEHRTQLMLNREIGLTKAYNLFHDSSCGDPDIAQLRRLHVELDTAVRDAYGWTDLDLGHGFYGEGKETRYTISPEAKGEVLRRLLKLNHERHAEEVAEAEKSGVQASKPKRKTASSTPTKPVTSALPITTTAPWLSEDAQKEVSLPEESIAPAQPAIQQEDIEPAILTWLVAREQEMALIEKHRPQPIRHKPLRPKVRSLHSKRLAKEEYGLQQLVGVPVGASYKNQTWGPLSETFNDALKGAKERGWISARWADKEKKQINYSLGPNAEEAIQIAFQVIGDKDQAAEEMLFYLDGDATIEAERQMTVHKSWADLRAAGRQGAVDEVIRYVETWKPDRSGFSRMEIRAAYEDLKQRGYFR